MPGLSGRALHDRFGKGIEAFEPDSQVSSASSERPPDILGHLHIFSLGVLLPKGPKIPGSKAPADHLHSMAKGFLRSRARRKPTSCPRLSRQ